MSYTIIQKSIGYSRCLSFPSALFKTDGNQKENIFRLTRTALTTFLVKTGDSSSNDCLPDIQIIGHSNSINTTNCK